MKARHCTLSQERLEHFYRTHRSTKSQASDRDAHRNGAAGGIQAVLHRFELLQHRATPFLRSDTSAWYAREFGELNHLVLPSGNTALPPNDIACFITTYECPVAIQCIQHIGKINTLFYQTEMYGKLYRLSNTLTGVPKKVCFRHRLHKIPKVSVHFGASGE